MNSILDLYVKLRENDKRNIGMLPLKNRIILSKLITGSNVDKELKYVWINRAVAQAAEDGSTAIMGLSRSDSSEQKMSRSMTLELRKIQDYPTPFEVKDPDDLKKFLEDYKEDYIIVKQNYPNFGNEEIELLRDYDFEGKKVVYASSKGENEVIGSNESLQKLSSKSDSWLNDNIKNYVLHFLKRNNVSPQDLDFEKSINEMQKLTKALIIPAEIYRGDIKKLRKLIKELLQKSFLPVFKFSDSISGYGVHYPRKSDGTYNTTELEGVLDTDENLVNYFVRALSKNGRTIDKNFIIKSIIDDGIILQKFISGNDYAIGFYKPLKICEKNFALGIIDIDISEVLTDGTAHYGDIIHYEHEFLDSILFGTLFEKRSILLYFATEILIYLLHLNEKIVSDPNDFLKVNFEDFGIQFMVGRNSGEIGLIEINGRTPSHNFNNFNLLSSLGERYTKLMPAPKVLCTSSKLISLDDFYKIVPDKSHMNDWIKYFYFETKRKFGNKCQLVSFQISGSQLLVYYVCYLGENDDALEIVSSVNEFFNNFIESNK